MDVLVVNSGSSTLKLSVVRGDRALAATVLDAPGAVDADALAAALERLPPADAAGHRTEIGAAPARVRAFVVTAREDAEIARQVRALLARAQGEKSMVMPVAAAGRSRSSSDSVRP